MRDYGATIVERAAARRRWCTAACSISTARPIAGAELDVWQNGDNRLYAVQDAEAPEEHLRGRFRTGTTAATPSSACGPMPYTDSPRRAGRATCSPATGRHPWRPAHIHMIVPAPGYRGVTTHIFDSESEYLDSDAVFAVKPSLLRDFAPRSADDPDRPDGVAGPWLSLASDFVLVPGEAGEPG